MTASLIDQLEKQKRDLRRVVYTASSIEGFPAEDPDESLIDPAFTHAVREAFNKCSAGKVEALRLQVDILRRARLAQQPEAIFRNFGAVRLIAPVRHHGKTVHIVDGGLVKLSPWTLQEKETFAKNCGVPVNKLPSSLFQPVCYSQEQLPGLMQLLSREARYLEAWLEKSGDASPKDPAASSADTPSLTGAALDVLQPGFADHLEMLFTSILKQSGNPEPERGRIAAAAQRGLHLTDSLKRISARNQEQTGTVSLHKSLEHWTLQLRGDNGVRFQLNLRAEHDTLHTRPGPLQHLLYTLLAGVADGLPPGNNLVGVSTRNVVEDGRAFVHVEIRDSGGLATFAEVSPELENDLLEEQNDAADEFADWVGMAERMEARLSILRDRNVITRLDLHLPAELEAGERESPDAGLRIWTVLENDAEAETLRRLLVETGASVDRVRSGMELRDLYVNAPAPPHLIMLDYLLSDIRGAALRTWVYEQDPDLPVILMSGFSATHPGVATVSNLPSTLYLQKPFDAQTLYDMIRMTVEETLSGA